MRMTLWILSVLLLLGSVWADDLKGLVGKTEGKKSDNQPSKVSDSPPQSEPRSGGGNPVPRINDNSPKPSGGPGSPPPTLGNKGNNPRNDSRNNSDNASDLFRKTPSRYQDNDDPFLPFVTDPRAKNPRRSDEDRPLPFVTDPRARSTSNNRPMPTNGNLAGLVVRTEGLNPWRWERFRNVYISFNWYYGHYCYEPIPYRVCYTPYWYYDPCPPFIPTFRVVYIQRPVYVYVEVPVEVPVVYYLERPQRAPDDREVLLGDLRRAWIYRDSSLIERHVRRNSYIAVYLDGEYAYSLPAQDYLDLTRDAMRTIKTDRITFDKVFKRGDNQLVVYGTHEYIDENSGGTRRVYIMYVFEREGPEWYLIEVGSSQKPLK